MPAGSAFTFITLLGLVASSTAAVTPAIAKALFSRRQEIATPAIAARTTTFSLTDSYEGDTFFDGFDYFTDADPTQGQVDFVDQATAMANNLTFINQAGQAVMRVDKTTVLQPGENRQSVRLTSKKSYGNSLIVLDLATMPHGCATWPAFWTTSSAQQWPYGGEIDIIEGVNEQAGNAMTLHTAPGCTLDNAQNAVAEFTGDVSSTDCNAFDNGNAGCGISDPDTNSYGHEFNVNGGGVFATLTDDSGVSIWRFARHEIPDDLASGNPNPASWPTPKAFWSSSTCSRSFVDQSQQMIFDITLCGQWAGAVFDQMGCPGSCSDFVADPNNFVYARFIVNSLRVYESS